MGFEKSAVKSHLLPSYLEENYGLVPVTISQFLDAYSKVCNAIHNTQEWVQNKSMTSWKKTY